MNTNRTLTQSIAGPALATGCILLIPLVAMQYTNEVDWTLSDFIVAGILLSGTGLTYKLITRKSGEIVCRIAVGFALFTGLFLIWVNLAVGIIGSENNPINMMYFGVIIVGITGAFIVRFKSPGMAYTMFAMAIAQVLVAAIVLITGTFRSPHVPVIEIVAVNGFFFILFVVSALLFRYASQVKVSA